MIADRSLFSFLAVAILCISCSTNLPKEEPAAALAIARAHLYQRSQTEFTNASYYKPSAELNDELASKLAPLLFIESDTSTTTSHFGLIEAARDRLLVQTNRPTVYFRKGKTTLGGKEREFALFLWFHPVNGRILPQGVRITLDSSGAPAIWEVLKDTSGVRQIFVSQSLEALAMEQFGTVHPGRQSAVEQPTNSQPRVVVSRVISDGPMTMGPALYLKEATFDVATLICRCMPPQARNVSDAQEYLAVELIQPGVAGLAKEVLTENNKIPAEQWLQQGPESLETVLRLPPEF